MLDRKESDKDASILDPNMKWDSPWPKGEQPARQRGNNAMDWNTPSMSVMTKFTATINEQQKHTNWSPLKDASEPTHFENG